MKSKHHSKNGIALLVSVLLISALVLSGCGGGNNVSGNTGTPPTTGTESSTAGNAKEYIEIKIADNEASTVYPPYIAEDLGFFEEEGINPNFVGVVNSGALVAAVLAGDVTVGGNSHVNRLISGVFAGAKVKAVASGSETSVELPHMKFVVLENSDIKKPADIIGKKIGIGGVGGCNEYTSYELLRHNGLVDDPRGQVEYVILPAGTEESALRTGEVDIVGFHGNPKAVLDRGGVRVLFTDYEVWGPDGGNTPWYFATDYIEKNPENVRRFVAAITKATNFINEHPDEAIAVFAKRTGLEPAEITRFYYAPDGLISEASFNIWEELLLDYGEISEEIPLDVLYTNEFNPAAR